MGYFPEGEDDGRAAHCAMDLALAIPVIPEGIDDSAVRIAGRIAVLVQIGSTLRNVLE
jgi:hypothetical protein